MSGLNYRVFKSILFLIKIAFYLTIIFIYNYIYFLEGANTVLMATWFVVSTTVYLLLFYRQYT